MSTSGVSARSDRSRLVGRVLTVFLTAWAVGLAFSLLTFVNRSLPTPIVAAGAALVMGLAGGTGARLLLRDTRRGLAAAAGMAASVAGQMMLGWLTFGVVGIRMSEAASAGPSWGGLLRVATGLAAAGLSLNAWRQPRLESSLPTFPPLPPVLPEPGSSLKPPGPGEATTAVEAPPVELPRTSPATRASQPTAPSRPRRPSVAPRQPAGTPLDAHPSQLLARLERLLPRWGRAGHRVRIGGRVDHRCPYCLEPVLPRDARGIVTCSLCHTRHHADCWAVTGVCQVPHHHA
jgi:hypothetical protein